LQTAIDNYTYGLQESVAKYLNSSATLDITFSPTVTLAGDFTLEFFINYSTDELFMDSTSVLHDYFKNQDSTLKINYAGAITDTTQNTALSITLGTDVYEFNNGFRYFQYQNNRYIHVALVREGGLVNLYINGVVQSASSSPTSPTLTSLTLTSASMKLIGHLNSVRLTALARYTKNFIPPNMRFGLISGADEILENIIFSKTTNPAELKDCIASEMFTL
jgi:hypothetical protein